MLFKHKRLLRTISIAFALRASIRFGRIKTTSEGAGSGRSSGYYGSYSSKPISPLKPPQRRHYAVWENAFLRRASISQGIPLLGDMSYNNPSCYLLMDIAPVMKFQARFASVGVRNPSYITESKGNTFLKQAKLLSSNLGYNRK